jgi:hypothetical protein
MAKASVLLNPVASGQPGSRASRPARFYRAHPDTSMVCRSTIGMIKFMIN